MYYYVNYKTFEHVHRTYVTYMRLEYATDKVIDTSIAHTEWWFTWQLTVKVMSKIRSGEPICVILEIYSYIQWWQKNGMKFLRFETPCRWFLINWDSSSRSSLPSDQYSLYKIDIYKVIFRWRLIRLITCLNSYAWKFKRFLQRWCIY